MMPIPGLMETLTRKSSVFEQKHNIAKLFVCKPPYILYYSTAHLRNRTTCLNIITSTEKTLHAPQCLKH